MFELDEQIRQDLAALRDRQGPSSTVEQRMLAALELKLGGPSEPEGPSGDSSGVPPDVAVATSAAKIAFTAKVVTATVALTGAGLIVLRLAVIAVQAASSDLAADHVLQPASEPTRPEPTSPASNEAAAPAPALDVSSDPPIESLPAPQPSRRVSAKTHDVAEAIDPLAAEFALLEAAHAAADARAALAALERHRDRFPTGQLADEREAMRVEALCELGRTAAAREVAERFLAARPNSPLRPRVRAACPTSGLGPEN